MSNFCVIRHDGHHDVVIADRFSRDRDGYLEFWISNEVVAIAAPGWTLVRDVPQPQALPSALAGSWGYAEDETLADDPPATEAGNLVTWR